MYCSNCGSKIPANAAFCANCGKQLHAPRPQLTQPVQPAYYATQPSQANREKKTHTIIGILASAVVVSVIVLIALLVSLGNRPPADPTDLTSNTALSTSQAVPTIPQQGSFRPNYTTILGGGQDVNTIMIYMVGSDLESNSGAATLDLQEMLDARFGSNVNVIIETGGCLYWQNSRMTDGEVQRWTIRDGELILLENLGQKAMLTPQALKSFIDYSVANYPANRYSLVFWDHGGGSLYGFGSDEVYPDSCLYLPDIAQSLAACDIKFDFVGFDACLMGSIETAYMLEPYADYLIASEENEPGLGWDYSVWLTSVGDNPSIDTVELGKSVVDSFIDQNDPRYTLSVVSLREIPYVYATLCAMMANASGDLAEQEFDLISDAVADTKSFSEGRRDMFDLVDLTDQCDLDGEAELVAAVESCVKYQNDSTSRGINGLSFYFPYTDLSVYQYARMMFDDIGFGGQIYEFYDSFVNILANGQRNSDGQSLHAYFTDDADEVTDFNQYDWYDEDATAGYDYDMIEYTELEIFWDDINEYYYLPMTDEDWDLLTEVQLQILVDDGEGFIDLGLDQYFENDEDGNLIFNYGQDNTWVAIGGQIVCYYAEDILETDDGTTFIGYVPAVLNETTDIEIILIYSDVDPDGSIAGYRMAYSNSQIGGAGTEGKGYFQFSEGDLVEFVCDFYTYEGDFDASYYFGDPLIIGETLPEVSYEDIGSWPIYQSYLLIDIYQNYAWTETVIFE